MLKVFSTLLLILLLPGCKAQPEPYSAIDTQAEIYAAVIMRLYGVEHGVIPPSGFPVIYIAQTLDNHVVMDTILQRAIEARLSALPAHVTWVPTSRDVPWEPSGETVKGGGAGISLGPVRAQKDGTVQVTASIVYGNVGGSGATFVLERHSGIWTITGTAGPEWIS